MRGQGQPKVLVIAVIKSDLKLIHWYEGTTRQ
jgi:hypothetical protein